MVFLPEQHQRIPQEFVMDFVSGNIDSAFQDDSLSTIVLVPPPGLSSLEIETAVVADCLDPDLEVVWQHYSQ